MQPIAVWIPVSPGHRGLSAAENVGDGDKNRKTPTIKDDRITLAFDGINSFYHPSSGFSLGIMIRHVE